MKEGWRISRFDEVFNLQMGKTPARDNNLYWENGAFPWVSISDLGRSVYIEKTKESITEKAVSETNIFKVPKNTVLMSFKLTIGRTAITSQEVYTNEAIMAFVIKDGFELMPKFLYYYLRSYNWKGSNKAVLGMTLNKKTISSQYIELPPLSVQRSIVEELDLLNSIISKKEEQIKELDNLAQATFHEMFGDPIENEKGWEVKKIKDVTSSKTNNVVIQKSNGRVCLLNLDKIESNSGQILSFDYVEENEIGTSTFPFDSSMVLYSKLRPYLNKVVAPDFSGYATTELVPFITNNELDKIYFLHLLRNRSMVQLFNSSTSGARMPRTKMDKMKNTLIPLPPLPLQQSFANKVASIEEMKSNITRSITDTRQLLDATMDKYFG